MKLTNEFIARVKVLIDAMQATYGQAVNLFVEDKEVSAIFRLQQIQRTAEGLAKEMNDFGIWPDIKTPIGGYPAQPITPEMEQYKEELEKLNERWEADSAEGL